MLVLPNADRKKVDKYLANHCLGLFYMGWGFSKVKDIEAGENDVAPGRLLSSGIEALRKAFLELLSMELIEEEDVRLYSKVSESIKDTDSLRRFVAKLDEIASGIGTFQDLQEFVDEQSAEPTANQQEDGKETGDDKDA